MEEIWKDIPGYEGLYQVSNLGRVKSLNYRNKGEENIIKLYTTGKGYLHVSLYKEGRYKYYRIHRLVLITFNPVENSENLQVDHINTIRTDNRLENLRWATAKENSNNLLTKFRQSEAQKGNLGIKNPKAIPIVQLALSGELINIYGSLGEAERNGFNNSKINECIKGKRNKHGGYKWMYLHEYLHLKNPNITEINLFGKTYKWEEYKNA